MADGEGHCWGGAAGKVIVPIGCDWLVEPNAGVARGGPKTLQGEGRGPDPWELVTERSDPPPPSGPRSSGPDEGAMVCPDCPDWIPRGQPA